MTEHELFLDSHRELMGAMRYVRQSKILVERHAATPDMMDALYSDADIVATRDNTAIRLLHEALPKETVVKIVETFLDSHRRLQ